MSERVKRCLYAHFAKHELIFNLIKIEYRDDYNHIDAIKITVKESDLAERLKFLVEHGLQTNTLTTLFENCYITNLLKFKVLQLNTRDIRIKELDGLNIEKPDKFFDDVIDSSLFDHLYNTALNISAMRGCK